jgi:transposase-like protein
VTPAEFRGRNERIAAMRRDGKSVKTIAVKFGVSEDTVERVCNRLNARLPSGFFRCGHERTPENSYVYSGRASCRQCKCRKATAIYRQSKGQTPVELERVWGSRA